MCVVPTFSMVFTKRQFEMSHRNLTFHGGVQTLIAFGVAFVALLTIFVPLDEVAMNHSAWAWYVQEVLLFSLIALLAVVLVKREEVPLGDIGLTRRHLLSAVLAFGGIYVGLTVTGVGLAELFTHPWNFALITETVHPDFAPLPAAWVFFVGFQFFVGLVEELAFRGYLQNKVIALLGGGSRFRITIGIVTASVVFGILHAPGAVLSGAGISGVIGVVVLRALTGFLFGIFYEVTQNVYFIALLHGLGNSWPLVIDWGDWSGTSLLVFFTAVSLFYLAATLWYRHWATDNLTPRVKRTDVSQLFSASPE